MTRETKPNAEMIAFFQRQTGAEELFNSLDNISRVLMNNLIKLSKPELDRFLEIVKSKGLVPE